MTADRNTGQEADVTDHVAIVRDALKARGRRTGYTLAYEDPLAPSSSFVEYIAEDALSALSALEQELGEWRSGERLRTDTVTLIAEQGAKVGRLEQERDEALAAQRLVVDRWERGKEALRARAEAAEAEVRRLRDALAAALANPRYLSIGSIENIVELRRLSREKYDSLAALAAGSAAAADNTGKEQT